MRYETLKKLIKEIAETQPNITVGEFAEYIKTKG